MQLLPGFGSNPATAALEMGASKKTPGLTLPPSRQDASIRAARAAAISKQLQRKGRRSTILNKRGLGDNAPVTRPRAAELLGQTGG